jgi:hypothetical protein
MRRCTVWLLTASLLLGAACGGDDDTESPPRDDGASTDTEPAGGEAPDACSLVTAEEATAFAGYELVMGQDSPLGCSYLPPDSNVADVVVRAVLLDGDTASVAANGFPNADQIITVDVGEDTVAVTTPEGDAVASVITGSDGRIVELAIVFVGIDPTDTARIEEAATLAVTALERWDG